MKPRLFSSHAASAALPPRSRPRPGRIVAATACAVALASVPAFGQVAVTLNGPPVQVRPYVPEPGLPNVTIPLGTLNPFPSDPSGGGSPGEPGGGGGGGGGSPGNVAPSDSLSTMLVQPWGIAAVANAQALGVNPSALAATCVLESGCQNIGGSGAQGAFQMYPAAFNEGLQTALAAQPSLASQIVQGDAGRMDPTTEAIAASGYLMQAVQSLQNAGIANPSVLDVRAYYNFGPASGGQIAKADNSVLMSTYVSAAAMQSNRIDPNETIGQWRAAVSAKIGTAAGQTVMS